MLEKYNDPETLVAWNFTEYFFTAKDYDLVLRIIYETYPNEYDDYEETQGENMKMPTRCWLDKAIRNSKNN